MSAQTLCFRTQSFALQAPGPLAAQQGLLSKVTAGKLRREEVGERRGGGEMREERGGQLPAVLDGIELVADRIPRGVDSHSIDGVETRVLSPATVALVSARAVQTSRKEAFGLAAIIREDFFHGPRLVHAGLRVQTSCHTCELSRDALREQGQAEKHDDRHGRSEIHPWHLSKTEAPCVDSR